ncbi:maestro heat-like repeat-containing protein family member 1 [Amia ocellicauda]|uniref:maestro heat-like repeat-containing protein family member 1 n=1 Tax=Amia ocellicauda TaxID=2972642 RepID=UPI003463F277
MVSECIVHVFDVMHALDTGKQVRKVHVQESIVARSHIVNPDRFSVKCLGYIERYPEMADHHQITFLQAMEKVLQNPVEAVSPDTASKIISVAVEKMVFDANVSPDVQQAASDVLVAMGRRFPGEVIDSLKFVLENQPNPMCLTTLGRLSQGDVSGIGPRLRAILEHLMPVLFEATSTSVEIKLAVCSALRNISQSVGEYTSGPGGSPDPTVSKEDFAPVMKLAFMTVLKWWYSPYTSSLQLQETVVGSLTAMATLLPVETVRANLTWLMEATLVLHKDGCSGDTLGQNVRNIVVAGLAADRIWLKRSSYSLLGALHQEISARQESSLDEHSEVLKSLMLIANTFPKKVATFEIEQLKSSSRTGRAASGAILGYLLIAAGKAESLGAAECSDGDPLNCKLSFLQGSSAIFCSVLEAQRSELKEQVSEILGCLQPCLHILTGSQLRVVVRLAAQNPEQAAETLLSWALPPDRSGRTLWRAMGTKDKLSRRLLGILMQKLNPSLPGDMAQDCVSAARQTVAVTCAVRELLANPERAGAFEKVFPQLFKALLLQMDCSEESLRFSRMVGIHNQDLSGALSVCRDTVLALQYLLVQTQLGAVTEQLEEEAAWRKLQSPESHYEGIRLLARAMARHGGTMLVGIVEALVPLLSADREQHRVTAMVFFSEVGMWLSSPLMAPHSPINRLLGCSRQPLRALLVKSLISRAQDRSVRVRLPLFQGLGSATAAQVEDHGRELLAILHAGLKGTDVAEIVDRKQSEAVLGALSALLQVLPHLRQDSINQNVIADICRRVTLLLESADAELRCAGATALGVMCRCQAVRALMMRELQDPSPEVTEV